MSEKRPVIHQPRVSRSVITDSYFYHTRHRKVSDKAFEVVGAKTDVTHSVREIVDAEIIEFARYMRDVHGMQFWADEPTVESDGKKYIHGIKERTGHTTLNEVIEMWRQEK